MKALKIVGGVLVVLLIALWIVGQMQANQAMHDREVAAAAVVKAEADKRAAHLAQVAAVREHPDNYLDFEQYDRYNKGIINDYAQLIGVAVTNRSPFPLKIRQAVANWYNGEALVGATPITFSGSIRPGETKTFSEKAGNMSSGTIEGNPNKIRIEVAQVDVIDTVTP